MSLANDRVLVTGATGFLGSALTRRLIANGATVRMLVRSATKAEALGNLGAEIVIGDITDAEATRRASADCAVIFHAAAALGGSYASQFPVNVTGTENLIRAAAQAGARRFIHVSSLAVYSPVLTGLIDESMAAIPGQDPYGNTKAAGERSVRDVSAETGLTHVIVRPAGIYGPGASLWTRSLLRLATGPVTPFIGDGRARAPYVFLDDVIDMLILVSEHAAAANQTFNCVSDPSPTWRDILTAYAQLAGKTPNWVALPKALGLALSGLLMLTATRGSINRDAPDYLHFITRPDKQFSMVKAHRLLGWQPQVDLETGVSRCAEFLRNEGLL